MSIARNADNTPAIGPHEPMARRHDLDRRRQLATGVPFPHNGRLSCFFAGVSTFLSFSIDSARAIRFRVECGMMTSSM